MWFFSEKMSVYTVDVWACCHNAPSETWEAPLLPPRRLSPCAEAVKFGDFNWISLFGHCWQRNSAAAASVFRVTLRGRFAYCLPCSVNTPFQILVILSLSPRRPFSVSRPWHYVALSFKTPGQWPVSPFGRLLFASFSMHFHISIDTMTL